MRECYDIIFPILKEKGIQAAFFINPAFVDNKTLFFKHKISLITEYLQSTKHDTTFHKVAATFGIPDNQGKKIIDKIRLWEYKNQGKTDTIGELCEIDFNQYLKEAQPFMTLNQIRELNREGFVIGSHSFDHPEFRKINEAQMREQIVQSIDYLKKHVNPEILTFAFHLLIMKCQHRFSITSIMR